MLPIIPIEEKSPMALVFQNICVHKDTEMCMLRPDWNIMYLLESDFKGSRIVLLMDLIESEPMI